MYKTSSRALGFLVWFRKFYNGTTDKTYVNIANDYKQGNYGTVRSYLLELSKNGFVSIENKGKHSQKFTVIEDRFMELI